MLKTEYNEAEKVLTCAFTGHLDTNSCIALNNEISDRLTMLKGSDNPELTDNRIIFDLKDVSYIASSFIRLCVSTAKQVPKGQFSIQNCDPFTKKIFIIAGLDDLLQVS